jgi:N-methylhydantoinase B
LETCDRFGEDTVTAALDEILEYSERRLRSILSALPDGNYESVDYFDDDGIHNDPLRIQVKITKRGDSLKLDFTGTSPQVQTAINVPMAGTRATVFCVVKTLLDPDLPPNAGVHRVISIEAPSGSLLNAVPPAAVGERSSTCQVVGDVVARALAQLVPGDSSAGCGALLGYRISGIDPRRKRYYVEYQAFAGGHGATAFSDGMDSVRVWASGAANAPVEADEIAYPILVHRYELRVGSGGAGQFRGGLGIRRVFSIAAEQPAMSTSGTRMRVPPPGIFGGASGQSALITINPGTEREQRLSHMVTDYPLSKGDVVEILTAGGGGWGEPNRRDPELLDRDLHDGKVRTR